jgi:hypothetical protein
MNFLKFVLFSENLNSGIDFEQLSGLTVMSWWHQKSQQKKLIVWKNFLYKSCRELLDLSALQTNLQSGQRGGQDLDYTLRDLKFPTWFAPCLLNETRWNLRLWKAVDEKNNFRVEGAAIRDHLRGRFGSGCLVIGSVLKTLIHTSKRKTHHK